MLLLFSFRGPLALCTGIRQLLRTRYGHWTGVESMVGVVGGCLLSAEKKKAIGIKEKTSVY